MNIHLMRRVAPSVDHMRAVLVPEWPHLSEVSTVKLAPLPSSSTPLRPHRPGERSEEVIRSLVMHKLNKQLRRRQTDVVPL